MPSSDAGQSVRSTAISRSDADADLEADYVAAGFGIRLGFGARPALLLVDFQRAYATPGSPLYAGAESSVSSAGRVLASARAAGIPIVFTRVAYSLGGRDGGPFYRKVRALEVFASDSPEACIVDELSPEDGELVLDKRFASAFFGTPLASYLQAEAVDSVLVTGWSTSGCVRATTVDAVQHGLVPLVVREAVGDRDARPHEQSLFDLDAKYADVVGEHEALAHLQEIQTARAGSRVGEARRTPAP